MSNLKSVLSCSFCGSRGEELRNLLDGPAVYICSGCVERCFQKIDANKKSGDLTPFLAVQEEFTERFLTDFLKR